MNSLMSATATSFHNRTKEENRAAVLSALRIGSRVDLTRHLVAICPDEKFKRFALQASDAEFSEFRGLVVATLLPRVLVAVDAALAEFAGGVSYLAPVRATAERFYRTQDFSVDEIGQRGENLAMFLHSLSPKDKNEFSDFSQRMFGFNIETHASGGHVSIRLRESDSYRSVNMADAGFGYSQVLPIVAQIWNVARGRRRRVTGRNSVHLIAIEQPELHLHPSYQANLVDLFVGALSLSPARPLRFVVETHSEAFVNRLGECVAQGKIRASDVSVVVFEKRAGGSTSTSVAKFDEAGVLMNWPFGFFSFGGGRAH